LKPDYRAGPAVAGLTCPDRLPAKAFPPAAARSADAVGFRRTGRTGREPANRKPVTLGAAVD